MGDGDFFYYDDGTTRVVPGFTRLNILNGITVGTKDAGTTDSWTRKHKELFEFEGNEKEKYSKTTFTTQTPLKDDSFYRSEPREFPVPPFGSGSFENGDQGSRTAGVETTNDILKTLKKNPLNNLYFKMLNTLGIKSSPGVLGTYFLVSPEDVIQTISSYKQAAWEVFKQEKYIRSLPVARRQIPLERMGKITNTDRNSVRPHIIEARMAKTDRMLTGMARSGTAGLRQMNVFT